VSEPGATVALEMVAVAWAAIGLLAAALVSSLFYLGSRMDALGARIDGQGSSLAARIDSLDARLTARIDSLETSLNGRIDTLDACPSSRLDALSWRMDAHLEHHAG